jgi:hypothetical protein
MTAVVMRNTEVTPLMATLMTATLYVYLSVIRNHETVITGLMDKQMVVVRQPCSVDQWLVCEAHMFNVK